MIDMPPRHRLPQQLRDRLLIDLRQGMDQPPRRSRTPYAVAAGVAAVVAGGVVAVTTVHGGSGGPGGPGVEPASAGKITGDTKGVEDAAQRCHAASAKVGGFPAKADWHVVAHTAAAGFTELAVKVADKPVFCEVTATMVTMSKFNAKPDYVPGSKTGTVFQGTSKVYGLVVDPAWHGIDALEDGTIDSTGPANTIWHYQDGMVLWWPEYPQAPLTVSPPNKKPASPLPKAPDATASVVDRPYTGPAPDHTSPEGQLLAECINNDKQSNPLADPDTWQPGPMLAGAGKGTQRATLLIMRGLDHVTTCDADPGSDGPWIGWWGGDLQQAALPKDNRPVLAPTSTMMHIDGQNRAIEYGAVSMDTASMTLTTAKNQTVAAQVHNGAFLANVAEDKPFAYDEPVITSVTVKDANGKVLYQGKPIQ